MHMTSGATMASENNWQVNRLVITILGGIVVLLFGVFSIIRASDITMIRESAIQIGANTADIRQAEKEIVELKTNYKNIEKLLEQINEKLDGK